MYRLCTVWNGPLDGVERRRIATAGMRKLGLGTHRRSGFARLYPLNVGYGHGYSVREVLRMVEKVGGKPLVIREEARRAGDPAYLVARADRIRAELGWQPRYDDLTAIVTHSLAWERKLQREPWV